jgi:hypothetical protein
MLDDVLRTAGLSWNQLKVVWVDDITGPKGPARAFKHNSSIDAAFVVAVGHRAERQTAPVAQSRGGRVENARRRSTATIIDDPLASWSLLPPGKKSRPCGVTT